MDHIKYTCIVLFVYAGCLLISNNNYQAFRLSRTRTSRAVCSTYLKKNEYCYAVHLRSTCSHVCYTDDVQTMRHQKDTKI